MKTTRIMYQCRFCRFRFTHLELNGHLPNEILLTQEATVIHDCPEIEGRDAIGVADLAGLDRREER